MNYLTDKDLKKFGFTFLSTLNERKKKTVKKKNSPKDFKSFGYEFFDGNKFQVGYQGYYYNKKYFDNVAKNLIKKFKLTTKSNVLDIGCAKGCLMFDLTRYKIPVEGLDVSFYAKNKAVPQVKNKIYLNAQLNKLNKKFDLIIAIHVFNYFRYSKIDKIIKLLRENAKNNFIIIEVISNRNKKKEFLSSDPNYVIAETQEWWQKKFDKLNVNTKNIYFRIMA